MINILALTRYSQVGASSRYRTYQYLPHLAKAGILCTVSPLFDDEYLTIRYRKGRPGLSPLLRGLARRLLVLRDIARYDLVIIEKELFPYMPFFIEKWLLKKTKAYTLDFDDALFHIYDTHKNLAVRCLLGDKYSRLMSGASLITVGNEYIAKYARQFSSHVQALPTVVDTAKYKTNREPEGLFTVGWIGTPNTQKYLQLIVEPLRAFFKNRNGRLLLIGANENFNLEGVPVELARWNELEEIEMLQSIHVGIMPLPDLPLERGKSGLKLIQYMACGKPVIASPVGLNVELVSNDVGFLARTTEEWLISLQKLAENANLRVEMGKRGRKRVEEGYDLAKWAKNYALMLKGVVEDKRIIDEP